MLDLPKRSLEFRANKSKCECQREWNCVVTQTKPSSCLTTGTSLEKTHRLAKAPPSCFGNWQLSCEDHHDVADSLGFGVRCVRLTTLLRRLPSCLLEMLLTHKYRQISFVRTPPAAPIYRQISSAPLAVEYRIAWVVRAKYCIVSYGRSRQISYDIVRQRARQISYDIVIVRGSGVVRRHQRLWAILAARLPDSKHLEHRLPDTEYHLEDTDHSIRSCLE